MRRVSFCWLWLTLLAIALPQGAAAAPTGETSDARARVEAPAVSVPTEANARADTWIDEGVELRKARDDRAALELFERAFELAGSPRALAQIALAEQALGRWRKAHHHLGQALAQTQHPWIAEHRDTLEAAREEIASRLGSVEVYCNVEGAEVRLDDKLLGRTPLPGPLRVEAGQSVIRLSADGYFEVARQIQVDPRGLSRVEITLTEIASVEAPSPPRASTRRSALVPPANASTEPLEPAPGTSARELLQYGSIGLAAVGVTIGATGYALREYNVRLYNDDARCLQPNGLRRDQQCPEENAAWRRGQTLAVAGFASASVFGGLALFLWLSPPAASQELEVGCALQLAGLSCTTRF